MHDKSRKTSWNKLPLWILLFIHLLSDSLLIWFPSSLKMNSSIYFMKLSRLLPKLIRQHQEEKFLVHQLEPWFIMLHKNWVLSFLISLFKALTNFWRLNLWILILRCFCSMWSHNSLENGQMWLDTLISNMIDKHFYCICSITSKIVQNYC